MQVLTVSPLVNGIPYEELSYFAKDDVAIGDLIEVLIKRRICRALVLSARQVEEERQSLRNASFNLKKINKVLVRQFLAPSIVEALRYSSSYLMQPLGVVLYDLLSEKSFEILKPVQKPENTKTFELLLLEQHHKERVTRYKTTIREYFSKKKSLVIFFPTITDIEEAKTELSFGIEKFCITLHSEKTEKQYKEAQQEIQESTHPLLILSTPSLLPWTRSDLGLVVIEREHSHYYYTHGDKGYDMRYVLETLCKKSNIPCLLGSHMLSLRAHMLYKQQEATEIMPLQLRNDTDVHIIPMTDENKTGSPYLSKTALHILHHAATTKTGHYFLYAHRKGMYPTTICSDCSTLFACKKCDRPFILHKVGGIRTYVCHECEHVIRMEDDTILSCEHCGGWRMTTLGVATTGVENDLERLGLPLFVIDGERTSTRNKVKKVYKEWRESPYGVLIGTEMAHNVVRDCDGIIILSLDALFSLPEYRTDEKILTLVTEMSEKIKIEDNGKKAGTFILQTRLSKNPVLTQLVSPSFKEVYEEHLKEREMFLLPPYYTVIKVTFENITDQMKAHLENELSIYVTEWFEQGRGITLLFIHIKESTWAHDEALRQKIKTIVSGVSVMVNPLHFFI